MKKIFSALAIAAMLFTVSCNKENPTKENQEPEVKPLKTVALSPVEGEAGTEVTISGENFDETVKVYFGEAAATLTSSTAKTLKVVAPENEPGEVVVKVVLGEQTASNLKFTYVDTKVAVTALSAAEGYDQDEVTISGKNFSAVVGLNQVKFGEVAAVVSKASATELTVEVPVNEVGASYDVTVTVSGETATAPVQFKYIKDVYKAEKEAVKLGLDATDINKVYDATFLSDGRLAIGTRGGSVYLYDVAAKTYTALYERTDGRRAHGLTQNSADGKLYVAFQGHNCVRTIDLTTGNAVELVTNLPVAMLVKFDSDNNMYVNCCDVAIIYKWAAGSYSDSKTADENNAAKIEFAKFDNSDGTKVKCMDFDNDGNLIVGLMNEKTGAASIWSVDKQGNKKIIAGSTTEKPSAVTVGDYRQPLTARFNTGILGLAVDKRGCIWFSDYYMMTYLLKPGKKGYEDASVTAIHSGANGWADGAQPENYVVNPTAEGTEVYVVDFARYGTLHRAWLTKE